MKTFTIRPDHLTLSDLRHIYHNPIKLKLDSTSIGPMEDSYNTVQKIVSENHITYGINTGIGSLATTKIGSEDLQILQESIVLSHAVGVGEPADEGLVRLIIVLKINSLGQGFSGISMELVDALIALVNHEVYPHIPVKGSVGASGDLAPLSHMASVLLGKGKASYKGEWFSAEEALHYAGLKKMYLGPREGVSLINRTQVSTAFALKGLFDTEDMYANAIVVGCLSLEAALGSRKPFDPRVQAVKRHQGQIDAAAVYRFLLGEHSEISKSHTNCSKVQDPYSLRCQPQVMGACLTQIRNAAEILLTESMSSSDNPVIIDFDIISAGNFHAESVAFAADNLALALAEIGSLSERRTALLMDANLSKLPAFLVNNGGVNTGFMTAHVTAAALVSENKCLAHPSSVDSIPTSANQEDHVSMAPAAGRRLWEMAENLKAILAIEWMCSCQGLDFRSLRTSPILEEAKSILREHVSFLDEDRFMATDIEIACQLIKDGKLKHLVPNGLLPSQYVYKKENGDCMISGNSKILNCPRGK